MIEVFSKTPDFSDPRFESSAAVFQEFYDAGSDIGPSLMDLTRGSSESVKNWLYE